MSSGLFIWRIDLFIAAQQFWRTAYFGHILPYIANSIILWGNLRLKTCQGFWIYKGTIRIISKLKHIESCRDAFKSSGVLPITLFETLVFLFLQISMEIPFLWLRNPVEETLNVNSHRLKKYLINYPHILKKCCSLQ